MEKATRINTKEASRQKKTGSPFPHGQCSNLLIQGLRHKRGIIGAVEKSPVGLTAQCPDGFTLGSSHSHLQWYFSFNTLLCLFLS